MPRPDPELPVVERTSVLGGDPPPGDRLEALRQVRGPGLCPLVRVGSAGAGTCLVHAVPAAAVEVAALRRRGPWRAGHVVTLALGVADALAALHEAGLAHGAVSASTVLVAPDGSVHLAGTGLAWSRPPGEPGGPSRAGDVEGLGELARDLLGAGPGTSALVLAALRACDPDPAQRPDLATLRAALGRCARPDPLLELLWDDGPPPGPVPPGGAVTARPARPAGRDAGPGAALASDPEPAEPPEPWRRRREPSPLPRPVPPARRTASRGIRAVAADGEPRAVRDPGRAGARRPARAPAPPRAGGRRARRSRGPGRMSVVTVAAAAVVSLLLLAALRVQNGALASDRALAPPTASAPVPLVSAPSPPGSAASSGAATPGASTSSTASTAGPGAAAPTGSGARASAGPPDGGAAGVPGPSGPGPAGLVVDRADPGWEPVLAAVDAGRLTALAAGSVERLALWVDPHGSAWPADSALARRVHDLGAVLEGGALEVLEVRPVRTSPGTVVLLVRDRRDPYTVEVDGVRTAVPERAARWWRVTLRAEQDAWRIAGAVPVDAP